MMKIILLTVSLFVFVGVTVQAKEIQLRGQDAKDMYNLLESLGVSIKPFIESSEIAVTGVSCLEGAVTMPGQQPRHYLGCALKDGEREINVHASRAHKLWQELVEDGVKQKQGREDVSISVSKIVCDAGFNIGTHQLFNTCTVTTKKD